MRNLGLIRASVAFFLDCLIVRKLDYSNMQLTIVLLTNRFPIIQSSSHPYPNNPCIRGKKKSTAE